MVERADLYAHVPLPGRPILTKIAPFPIYDTILGEEETAEAVTRLSLHRAAGPSGMKSEHLRIWYRTVKQEENIYLGNWEKVIAIIQADFRGVELAVPYTWQTVVMIPQRERHELPGDWPCEGPVKGDIQHRQSPAIV